MAQTQPSLFEYIIPLLRDVGNPEVIAKLQASCTIGRNSLSISPEDYKNMFSELLARRIIRVAPPHLHYFGLGEYFEENNQVEIYISVYGYIYNIDLKEDDYQKISFQYGVENSLQSVGVQYINPSTIHQIYAALRAEMPNLVNIDKNGYYGREFLNDDLPMWRQGQPEYVNPMYKVIYNKANKNKRLDNKFNEIYTDYIKTITFFEDKNNIKNYYVYPKIGNLDIHFETNGEPYPTQECKEKLFFDIYKLARIHKAKPSGHIPETTPVFSVLLEEFPVSDHSIEFSMKMFAGGVISARIIKEKSSYSLEKNPAATDTIIDEKTLTDMGVPLDKFNLLFEYATTVCNFVKSNIWDVLKSFESVAAGGSKMKKKKYKHK